jgi:hypothetical protein
MCTRRRVEVGGQRVGDATATASQRPGGGGRSHGTRVTRKRGGTPPLTGVPGGMTDYDPDDQVNLRGFAGSMTVYLAALGALAGVARGRPTPARYEPIDLVLGGVAVHKFTRLLSKGAVTSPVRAPFTQFEHAAGSSEHAERPRDDSSVRHTVGELLTCPFCLGVWTGTAYVAGLALAPRTARAWAALGTVTAVSDFLQHGYARVRTD